MKKTFLLLGLLAAMFASVQAQMVLVFDTNLDEGTTVSLPLDGTVNVTVDWGDGNTEAVNTTGLKEHTYATEGEYTVQINGTLSKFGIYNWPNLKLKRVTSFGEIGITSLNYAFMKATNLIEIPATFPPTVTSLSYTFCENSTFNLDISNWDVSHVTDFVACFIVCHAFNQDIGEWDVSGATNMFSMFANSTSFNQDISSWNVSNVTTFRNMFTNCSAFNQDISSWNVSSVTNMNQMFYGATSFNQNLSSWIVDNVTNFTQIFYGVTLSTENYDAILTGWSQQSLQSGLNFHGGNSKYSCVGEAARNQIITNFGWTITDGGLQADNVAPIADETTLVDVTAECQVSSLTAPTATDNCAGSITGTTTTSLPITASSTITWTYDDGNGNTSTQTQNVVISDATAPLADIATLADVTAECEVTTLTAPTATDNCTGSITGTHNATLPITAQGTTVVTWTYDDGNGNTSTQTQNVVIDDNTNPTITCVGIQTVTADATNTYTVSGTEFDPISTNDNCGVASVENDFNSTSTLAGATLPEGTTTITWTVTDNAGNTQTCSFELVVNEFVGIEQLDNTEISVYPNPVKNSLSIDISNNQKVKVRLTDISGRELLSVPATQNNTTIDMSSHENGLYFLHIENGSNIETVKIIKQ